MIQLPALVSARRLHSEKQIRVRRWLSDFWLAGLPFLAALVCVTLQANNQSIQQILTAALFASSLALLLKYVKPSLESRRAGQLMVLLGFVGWYSWPALFGLWSASSRFGEGLPVFIHDETVVLTVLYLSLFLIVWLLTSRLFFRESRSKRDRGPVAVANPPTLIFIALLACALGLIPYLASDLSITEVIGSILEGRSVDKPWAYTENLGNRTSAILHLTRSALTAGAGLLLVVFLDRKVRVELRILSTFVALIITIVLFFDQGTRSLTAIMVLPAIILFLIKSWNSSKLRATAFLVVIVAVLFLALQFQLLFRTSYTRHETSDLLFEDWATLGGTADYFTETALAIELVPTYHDFFKESALLQFVVSPIPRFLWESKPVSQIAWFYTLMRWGIDIYSESGNTFPGIVGQYYMSWGSLGPIIIGIILALVSSRCDASLSRIAPEEDPYSFTVRVMLAVWLLVTYRYLSPGFLYPVIFAAGIVALSKVSLWKNKRGALKSSRPYFSKG